MKPLPTTTTVSPPFARAVAGIFDTQYWLSANVYWRVLTVLVTCMDTVAGAAYGHGGEMHSRVLESITFVLATSESTCCDPFWKTTPTLTPPLSHPGPATPTLSPTLEALPVQKRQRWKVESGAKPCPWTVITVPPSLLPWVTERVSVVGRMEMRHLVAAQLDGNTGRGSSPPSVNATASTLFVTFCVRVSRSWSKGLVFPHAGIVQRSTVGERRDAETVSERCDEMPVNVQRYPEPLKPYPTMSSLMSRSAVKYRLVSTRRSHPWKTWMRCCGGSCPSRVRSGPSLSTTARDTPRAESRVGDGQRSSVRERIVAGVSTHADDAFQKNRQA
mmetsp:Transcript_68357/g.163154  ORF Transcript_68357/g.163154 Transcript_68357/m.163154 type:complete len:331 (-) Transcript_68357:807-1799(-)